MSFIPSSVLEGVLHVSQDFDALNAIAQADGVRESVQMPDNGDLRQIADRAVFLMGDGGFIAFLPTSPNCWEFHTCFLPGKRGRNAHRAARAAAEWMFMRTDALELHTLAPTPAARPPRSFGFKPWFNDARGETHRLHILDWAKRAPSLEAWGAWFHDELDAAKEKHGASVEAHDEDRNNNRYAGLALGMVKFGNAAKAEWAYNAWAMAAGYVPMTLLDVDPVRVDTGDAVIRYDGQNMEFEQCR